MPRTTYTPEELRLLTDLVAKRFIARRDVKAHQYGDGVWTPHTTTGKRDGEYIPWRRRDFEAHFQGADTFGHYLVNPDGNKVKLFAFDVDLEKDDLAKPDGFRGSWLDENGHIVYEDVREAWRDRRHPARQYLKFTMMWAAHSLGNAIQSEFDGDIKPLVAYSGNKGIHVYGLIEGGMIPAKEARLAAGIVMDTLQEFQPTKGDNFWRSIDQVPINALRNLTIEVFPKQDEVGQGLGNLMRLPLGRNLKAPKDPTFFIDMTTDLSIMRPANPFEVLENPPRIP